MIEQRAVERAAHDLAGPVATLLGYLELLENDGLLRDPDGLRLYLAMVRGEAANLARLIGELTAFAELMEGPRSTDAAEPATLPALIRDLAGTRPVRIQASAEAEIAAVDEHQLRLALGQLLENAFRFGKPAAEVVVEAVLADPPPRLVVRVISQGELRTPHARDGLSDPSSGHQSSERPWQGDLGLGLPMARHAAEEAGGSLTMEPGLPTTFRLELPLLADPLSRRARAERERAALADAQALRAIQELRSVRSAAADDRTARVGGGSAGTGHPGLQDGASPGARSSAAP